MEWMPGDNEAAAAIGGMTDTYGRPAIPTGLMIGQRATWRPNDDEWATGIVIDRDDIEGTYLLSIHVPGSGRVIREARADDLAPF